MNFLWIVTTQWRAQACGYAGDPNVRTPEMDRLASRSIQFTEAVTPHPFGPFARAALLTGIESPANGVRDYFDPLPRDARTLAHDFSERGYATSFFGKWHLAPRDAKAPLVGLAHARTIVPPEYRGGFDFWEGFEGGFQLMNPWLHGSRLPEPTQVNGYQSDVLSKRCGDWIATEVRQPWFAVLSLEPPHPPYAEAPARGLRARGGNLEFRENVPDQPEVRDRAARELAGYYAQIEATDAALGGLLSRIDFSNTAVLFTSVHGDMHGSHGRFRKGWPYEESVRVPLLLAVPGVSACRNDAAISLVDLRGLCLAHADGKEGVVLPSWARISMPSVVNLPHQCDRVWRGVRSAQRKLVLNDDGSPWLFFDLEKDPFEERNLAAEPEAEAELGIWQKRVTTVECA